MSDDEEISFSGPFIEDFVKNICLDDVLPSLNILEEKIKEEIRQLERTDTENARKKFLNVMIDIKDEDQRYQLVCDFKTALEKKGYVRLIYLLERKPSAKILAYDQQNIEIIGSNRGDFISQINVNVLVVNLFDKGLVNQSDRFDVDITQSKSGGLTAFWQLADKLRRKRNDWGTVIIESLKDQQPHLTPIFDPEAVTDEDSDDLQEEGGIVEEELDSDYEQKIGEKESEKDSKKKKIAVMKMRSYQEELAAPALKGCNTVICAETGTGKTWVALHITKEHLNSKQDGSRVIFLARTNALVKQQYQLFQLYLEPDFKVFHLQTDTKECLGMDLVKNEYNIFFMTPQILLNNINLGKVQMKELSLIIFDECHHTKKREPYNNLMQRYIELKYQDKDPLPQIVGLTATIGIGDSTTESGAVGHMMRICANLDVGKISTVRKNEEEFRQHVNTPTRETIKMGAKEKDPCKILITEVMDKVEQFINCTDVPNKKEVSAFWGRKPTKREGKHYQKWASRFRNKAACKIQNKQLARLVNTAMTHLLAYNEALGINYLMNIEHVLNHLHKRLDTDSTTDIPAEEKQLLRYWKELQNELEDINKKQPLNPNLKLLRDKMVELIQHYEDIRGLIFVQTRAEAFSLSSYLNEELGGMSYKAAPFTGTSSSEASQGMPEFQKIETLQRFSEGKINVLTATLVGSEGIDVPECNFVITYNYTGNEANIIQMSGRARKKGSRTVHISDHVIQRREELGLQKAIIMQNALNRLKDIPPDHFKRQIEEYQQDDLKRKLLKLSGKTERKSIPFELICFKCHSFAVSGHHVRVYGNQHRVVTDGKFLSRSKLAEIPNPSKYTRSEIKCQKCELKWGTTFQIGSFEVPVLGVTTLLFCEDKMSTYSKFKKWGLVNYKVDTIKKLELLEIYKEIAAEKSGQQRED